MPGPECIPTTIVFLFVFLCTKIVYADSFFCTCCDVLTSNATVFRTGAGVVDFFDVLNIASTFDR